MRRYLNRRVAGRVQCAGEVHQRHWRVDRVIGGCVRFGVVVRQSSRAHLHATHALNESIARAVGWRGKSHAARHPDTHV